MINFQPDICLPKDPNGFGIWLAGHFFEHKAMALACLNLTPQFIVPEYDIYSWRDEPELAQQWLVAHEQIHQVLREACNVTGVDLSLVDFSKDEDFLEWMDAHASEHQNFRTALGFR